jgi:hypothetical protein
MLAELQKSIWRDKQYYYGTRLIDGAEEARRLTRDELKAVRKEVRKGLKERRYVCQLRFGCAIDIYSLPENPGVPVSEGHVLSITKNHLPIPKGKDRTTFTDGWRAFSPLTHSEANTELLEFLGMDPPREKHFYDY